MMRFILNLVDDEILKMMTRQVHFGRMLVTREIGSNYKPNSTYPLKIFADELRKQGHPIQSGERIDYVFVKCQIPEKNLKQGYKMRIPEMYWNNSLNEPIDYIHYIDKILKNPVDQIIYIAYKDTIDEIERRCTPAHRRRGKVYTYIKHDYINTWAKMLKVRSVLVESIRIHKPHFPSQEPAFMQTFSLV